MKALTTTLLILLITTTSAFASHYMGGEITWRCLSNGKYVFFMKLYRDCAGIPSNFTNETIDIVGNPLPVGINSINMKPDSTLFLNTNNGDISPYCTSGSRLSCSNGTSGTIQMLSYQSDPINLNGTPPASGWEFSHSPPCCYGAYDNVLTSGGPLIRSVMYANNSGICNHSSASFAKQADYLVCTSLDSYISYAAMNPDFDSLTYHLDFAQSGTATNPINLQFKNGYSLNSPTPDSNISATNKAFHLDSQTGIAEFNISNLNGRYLVTIRVDAHRDGVRHSSVSRQIPIITYSCPLLSNSATNVASTITINGGNLNGSVYYDTVLVKRTKAISIVATDTNFQNNNLQILSMIPYGLNNTVTYGPSSTCQIAGRSCAFYQNATPFLNITSPTNRYNIQGVGAIGTQFVWQPQCTDLDSNETAKTHYFYFTLEDDFCPNPARREVALAITVMPDTIPCALVTGSDDPQFIDKFSIYPNPTIGQITIDLPVDYQSGQFTIRDMQGRLVQEAIFMNQSRLNLEIDGEAGIYLISLINQDGTQRIQKLIKRD